MVSSTMTGREDAGPQLEISQSPGQLSRLNPVVEAPGGGSHGHTHLPCPVPRKLETNKAKSSREKLRRKPKPAISAVRSRGGLLHGALGGAHAQECRDRHHCVMLAGGKAA